MQNFNALKTRTCHFAEFDCGLVLQRGHGVAPHGDACCRVARDGPQEGAAGLIEGCRAGHAWLWC